MALRLSRHIWRMASRHIPEDVKRRVRQRCKFGCVICGIPVFHYDHIQPFAVGGEHSVENIALLCPSHHQDKTSGRITAELVLKCANEPANSKQASTTPHLHIASGDRARFVLGSSVFESGLEVGDRFEAVRISGHTVFGVSFEDGFLLFDVLATDASGKLILQINKGELAVATGVWDYRLEGRELEIRSEETAVSLRLRFEERGFSVPTAHFVLGSTSLDIQPSRVVMHSQMIRNFVISGGVFTDCRVGIDI
jgi:hypothetical protein